MNKSACSKYVELLPVNGSCFCCYTQNVYSNFDIYSWCFCFGKQLFACRPVSRLVAAASYAQLVNHKKPSIEINGIYNLTDLN